MKSNNFKNKTAKILFDVKSIILKPKKPFKLTSGRLSPVYIDCRKIISHIKARRSLIAMSVALIKKEINLKKIDFIAGGETAGIPYAAWISEKINKPMLYIRKKPKDFGKLSQIEGVFTDGKSKIHFCNAIRKAGGVVSDIFVIFNYGIFSDKILKKNKLKLHFLTNWNTVIKYIKKKKSFTQSEIKIVENYLFNKKK